MGFIPVTCRHGTKPHPIGEVPMKPAYVSLAVPLLFLIPPAQGLQTVVVRGRITSAATGTGIEAANVRIVAEQVSVGTDAEGRYRIVLLERFRGRDVDLQVRA